MCIRILESERQTHRHPAEFQVDETDGVGQRLEKKMRMTGAGQREGKRGRSLS